MTQLAFNDWLPNRADCSHWHADLGVKLRDSLAAGGADRLMMIVADAWSCPEFLESDPAEMRALIETTRADAGIFSWVDDIEWFIVSR